MKKWKNEKTIAGQNVINFTAMQRSKQNGLAIYLVMLVLYNIKWQRHKNQEKDKYQ